MTAHVHTALVELGLHLRDAGYIFTTVSPETHRIVNARAVDAGRGAARSLRDVFGWSRPFDRDVLPPRIFDRAHAAGVLETDGSAWRSTVRFSTLGDRLFVHSAYPTNAPDAVFFGPDTYRFATLLRDEAKTWGRIGTVVDVGCGSGAGGIVVANAAERVVLADVNAKALAFAAVNLALAGFDAKASVVTSDVLSGVTGSVDLIIANPPFMADGGSRTYRDGGGQLGEALAIRIVHESVARLSRGGRLVLYTGAAIVEGADVFRDAAAPFLDSVDVGWSYREIDPDVFGEEIAENAGYADVERIAAVALVVTVR